MSDEAINTETGEYEREVDVDSGALATLSKAEFDMQIATAKRYPRSIDKFHKDALTLVTLDADTARSMYYKLPRDGKDVVGPTIRFAEIIGSCWGNLHYGGRVVSEEERFLSAQGVAWDLEKNVRANIEVRRRITNKKGKRYSDDMIVTTSNAAISIALRNAIFKVVPVALTKNIMDQAKEVSLGKGLTMEQRRENAFKYFRERQGATQEQVLAVINRRGADDITLEDLITLMGMRTAIEDNEATWQEILEEATKPEEPQSGKPKPASQLLRELEEAGKDKPEAPTEAKPTETKPTIAETFKGTAPQPETQQPETKPESAAKSEQPAQSKPEAHPGSVGEQRIEDFQASTDAISPEQQSALATAVGRARLTPKQVEHLKTKYGVADLMKVNFGQFKEIIATLLEQAAARGKGF